MAFAEILPLDLTLHGNFQTIA